VTDPQQPAPREYAIPTYAPPAYVAPGGGYTAPPAGYTAAYMGAPPKASSALGLVSLLLALGATVVASLVASFFAMEIGRRLSANGNIDMLAYDPLTFLSPARDVVLGAEITFWVATLLGTWALVQGIVAIAKRRGRGMGIAAVIIAAIGPFAFGIIAWTMLAVGIGVGAA